MINLELVRVTNYALIFSIGNIVFFMYLEIITFIVIDLLKMM